MPVEPKLPKAKKPRTDTFAPVDVTIEEAFAEFCQLPEPKVTELARVLKAQGRKVSYAWLLNKAHEHKWYQRVAEINLMAGRLAPDDQLRRLYLQGAAFQPNMINGLLALSIVAAKRNLEELKIVKAEDYTIMLGFMEGLQRMHHSAKGFSFQDTPEDKPEQAPVNGAVVNLGEFKSTRK